MKTLAAVIFFVFLSCASQPAPIYVTVQAPQPAAPVPQPAAPAPAPTPQPAAPAVDFWALYTGPAQGGADGAFDDDQQAYMILYFCQRYLETSTKNFTELYGTPERCHQKNVEAYKKSKNILTKMSTWQNVKETVGHHCMVDAVDEYCNKDIGFCFWDGVWMQFENCVKRENE